MFQLYNDCCLNVMKTMGDKSVNLILTSPPYNMRTRINNNKYTKRENTKHFSKKYKHFTDDLPIEEYYNFHKSCIQEMLRISPIVIYNFQVVTGSKESMFKIIGDFNKDIKDIVIWDKGHGQPAMHDGILNKATELILIMESPQKLGREISNSYFERGTLSDIWRVPRERSDYSEHSALMPTELARIAINNFSKEGDTILDPFCGLATTGIVCCQLRRNFIGIELEKEYYELGQQRLNNTPEGLF